MNSNTILIRKLADTYLSSKFISFTRLSELFGISAKKVSDLLFIGITDGILDDNTAKAVADKVIHFTDKGVMQRRIKWNDALKKRRINAGIQDKQDTEIELLKMQIESYDSFFVNEEDAPSKEELIRRLQLLQSSND